MDEAIVKLEKVSKTFRDFWLRPTVEAVSGLDLEVRRGLPEEEPSDAAEQCEVGKY